AQSTALWHLSTSTFDSGDMEALVSLPADLEALRAKLVLWEYERNSSLDALKHSLRLGAHDGATGNGTGEDDTRQMDTLVDMQEQRAECCRALQGAWDKERRVAEFALEVHDQRMNSIDQALELEQLRLDRVLDGERIEQLLRLTDPKRKVKPSEGRGKMNEGLQRVSPGRIADLEAQVAAIEQ
ncbi:unnamed protein product, partial [Chrysoparadoxa australica]